MSTLTCRHDARRNDVRTRPDHNGLDYVEVDQAQTTLTAFFLGRAPAGLTLANFVLTGGRSPKDAVTIESIELQPGALPTDDDRVLIRVSRPGDYSTYRLSLTGLDGIDPRYSSVDFSFKTHCPSELDCAPACQTAPPHYDRPAIDYLAKDYASFRQLIFDRLALICPDWQERHVPDLGVALVELFAYAGDYLSYYQDAVATEAYLETARRRPSVRRHTRLVDYILQEGTNARAFLAVETRADLTLATADVLFTTGVGHLLPVGDRRALQAAELEPVSAAQYEVFAPLTSSETLPLWTANNRLHFYTWGQRECCLRRGATAATLAGTLAAGDGEGIHLSAGSYLLFEEVLGPVTLSPFDADPSHRQAVRLTSVTASTDPLYGTPIIEITWQEEDALRFDLCLSALGGAPECRYATDISIAWGNIILVDHGRPVTETLGPVPSRLTAACCECDGQVAEQIRTSGRFRPKLKYAPLTFSPPVDDAASAAAVLKPNPAQALPQIVLSAAEMVWHPRYDLLDSGPADTHFVVEMEEDRTAFLRFGDGELGRRPPAGESMAARYRIGSGPAGNVGPGAINTLVHAASDLSADIAMVSNRLAASGGTLPTSMREAKLAAPTAFRFGPQALQRAIIADDYAAIASRHPKIQRAAARLVWTGSWFEAEVGVDPLAAWVAQTGVIAAELETYLEAYRRLGHDLDARPAHPVPIDLALTVCVAPEYLRGQLKAALLAEFGTRTLADGTFGMFHPDRQSFGEDLYLSAIIEAAQSLPGVVSVRVDRFQRQFAPPNQEIEQGYLPLGPFEIAQLENDPNHPDRGRLVIHMTGGR